MTKEKITILTAKDCDISYFRGSGNGGQKKQKTSSGVQIIHRESGALGRCDDTRSQATNKSKAFVRMTQTPKFKLWLSKKLYQIQNEETIEEAVERQMSPENLVIEVKNEEGKWIQYNESNI